MRMNIEDIQFGSLYSFKYEKRIRKYKDPIKDTLCFEQDTVDEGTLFVPLEIKFIQYFDDNNTKLNRIKILLTDGSIWYISTINSYIDFIEVVSKGVNT